jgi:hypothetical protein
MVLVTTSEDVHDEMMSKRFCGFGARWIFGYCRVPEKPSRHEVEKDEDAMNEMQRFGMSLVDISRTSLG